MPALIILKTVRYDLYEYEIYFGLVWFEILVHCLILDCWYSRKDKSYVELYYI